MNIDKPLKSYLGEKEIPTRNAFLINCNWGLDFLYYPIIHESIIGQSVQIVPREKHVVALCLTVSVYVSANVSM